MERITHVTNSQEDEVYKSLIENQIEYYCDNLDEDFKNKIDSMTKEEYEKFVEKVLEEFWNDSVMWEVIDEHIADNLFKVR